jgi:hypothetical protein
MGKIKMVRIGAEAADCLKAVAAVTGYSRVAILNTAFNEWIQTSGRVRLEKLGVLREVKPPAPPRDMMLMWKDASGNIRNED